MAEPMPPAALGGVQSATSALHAVVRALESVIVDIDRASVVLNGGDAALGHRLLGEMRLPLSYCVEWLTFAHDRAPAGTAPAWLLSVNRLSVETAALRYAVAGLEALVSSTATSSEAFRAGTDLSWVCAPLRVALCTARGLFAEVMLAHEPPDAARRSPLERVRVALTLLPSRGPTHEEHAEDPGALDECLAQVRAELEALQAQLLEVPHAR